MLKRIVRYLIARAERRVGVTFDYVHKIAEADIGLLMRYNKLFGFLDPNRKVPAVAYHAARLRGAIAADCGTCVEAEINLARNAGVSLDNVDRILRGDCAGLGAGPAAVVALANAVTGGRQDNPEARERIRDTYGEVGLIELCFAMNGAALLPGVKRAMGYSTACDIEMLRKLAGR